jgi:hypothetical protein
MTSLTDTLLIDDAKARQRRIVVLTYVRAYVDEVRQFLDVDHDRDFSLRLDTTDGLIHQMLQLARLRTRFELLESVTETQGFDRQFRDGPGVRRLEAAERGAVCAAFERYLHTIPESKKFRGIATTATAPRSPSARCRPMPTRCRATPGGRTRPWMRSPR